MPGTLQQNVNICPDTMCKLEEKHTQQQWLFYM